MLPLEEAAGHLIRRAQQRHTLLWSQVFGGDVTGPQYAVLGAIGLEPGIDQSTVVQRASLDKSSTADVVLRLARRGWLTVVKDPRDARRKTLQLAPLARIAMGELTRKATIVQARLLESIPELDRQRFVWLLRRVAYAGNVPDSGQNGSVALAAGAPVLVLQNTPGHLLRRAQQVHTVVWGDELTRRCTAPQYAVMSALWSSPGIDQRSAGELASLDKSTMTDVVDRLVTRGWITRRKDEHDGRRWLLWLTAEAITELDTLTPCVRQVQDRLMEPLTNSEQKTFIRQCQAMAYSRSPDPLHE